VEGFFIERFLNIAAHRECYLWNIKWLGTQKARMYVSRKGYALLDEVAEKTKVEMKKVAEVGLPFYIAKYRKRTAFIIGGGLFFVFLFVMSFFLWNVDIEYTGAVPMAEIQQGLEASGLSLGMLMGKIDEQKIEAYMMTNFQDFAWVGVSKAGTTAVVQIEPRIEPPQVEDTTVPCNIVATKAGVIDKINTKLGQSMVSVGTAVTQGQLLVSGALDSQALGARFVHATSDILAQTWITESQTAPLFKTSVTRTGKTKSKHSLQIFGWQIPLYFSDKVAFADYDRVSDKKQLSIGNKLFLPIIFHYDKFYEVKKENVTISETEAVAIATDALREKMKGELSNGGWMENEAVTTSMSEAGEIVVTVTWECYEDIGQSVPILTNN